jgi:lipopolysaccharide/colanic/teichoic acid biosynthesis glycosyltransferase
MRSHEDSLAGTADSLAVPAVTDAPPTGVSVRGMQRAVDVMSAGVLLLATSPIIILTLLISSVVFRANPLYLAPRVGLGGKQFTCPKIRSLPVETPRALRKDLMTPGSFGLWSRGLRKSHVDELPQLWSVLVGSMSLVGPRPDLPEFAELYDANFWFDRLSVRPGITGLWQVSEAVGGLIHESPEYDQWYVAHRNWKLDTWIVWRTVLSAFGFRGITLGDIPMWARPPLSE